MKTNFDCFERKFHSLQRFATDLSHRTQETEILEHFQKIQIRLQLFKSTLKDQIRKTADYQTKYKIYSDQQTHYDQMINEYELNLDEILQDIEQWTNPTSLISRQTIQITSKRLRTFCDEQTKIQRQANVVNELIENLLDSVENNHFFR